MSICPACGGAKNIYYDGNPDIPLGECLTCNGTGEVVAEKGEAAC
jgi:Zn ribbon nucleic-acid-binding protein